MKKNKYLIDKLDKDINFSSSLKISKKLTGKDVKIGIVSTGVPNHHDIKNIEEFEIFSKSKSIDDDIGVATQVCGMLTSNSEKINGICKDSKLILAKSYNDRGEELRNSIISSMLWMILKGVDIISIPSEGKKDYSVFKDVIKKAYNLNIPVFIFGNKNDEHRVDEAYYIDTSTIKGKKYIVNNKINKKIEIEDTYTCFGDSKYIIPNKNAYCVGLISGVASLVIEEYREKSSEYTNIEVYSRINEILY